MTEQLTIKMNQERFEPLFDDMKKFGFQLMKSNSALTGFCVWFVWWFINNKLPSGETMFEKYCKIREKSKEECMLYCMQEYVEFTSK